MKDYLVSCSYKLNELDFWKSGQFDEDTGEVFSESGQLIGKFLQVHGFIKGICKLPKYHFSK